MNQNKEHNEDSLNQKFGKKTSFTMPDNYFNDLENDLMSKLMVEDLPEKCGFETPKDYFDGLENKILKKVNFQQEEKGKIIPFRKRFVQFGSMVAAASVLLLVVFQFTKTKDVNITIDDWFEANDVNTYELATLFDENDFSDLDELSFNFENETIDDYIDNIDNSSFFDEIQ